MATYTFDDGSTISNDQTPTGWTTTSTAATDGGVGSWVAQDAAEQAKYGGLYPKNGQSFWENLALLGVSKGFDAHFQQQSIDAARQNATATYAGQNGKTYVVGQQGGTILGMPPILLLLIGGALIFALAD